METTQQKIYRIVDSFLVEAKNQHGEERSIDALNRDRHLAVKNLMELFRGTIKKCIMDEKLPSDKDIGIIDDITESDYLNFGWNSARKQTIQNLIKEGIEIE